MSDEHKAALAKGRAESRAVRDYLDALQNPPSSSDPEQLRAKVAELEDKIAAEDSPVGKLQLVQQRLDVEDELATADSGVDMAALEEAFVEAAASYAERKGIAWPAWRELGVPAAVLKRAGVKRTRRSAGS